MVAGLYPVVREYSANRGIGSSTASFENSKRRIVATPMYCRIRNTPWFHPYCARLGRGYTYPEVFSVPASSTIHYSSNTLCYAYWGCVHEPAQRDTCEVGFWASAEVEGLDGKT